MKYKTFRINVFEQEPGKWRARMIADPATLFAVNNELGQFASSVAHSSAVEAMTNAMEMVDAVSFSRSIERTIEKRWRCLRKADRKLGAV
jgi:hypothetical protein